MIHKSAFYYTIIVYVKNIKKKLRREMTTQTFFHIFNLQASADMVEL
jgi:hypothetical protein